MYKCRLCQQMFNNLTNIYNNRLKSLAQIILKLKGFKDSWNVNDFALCDECIKGVENVALFWEHIPEAKKENSSSIGVFEELELPNGNVLLQSQLPAITSAAKEDSTEIKHEPIKIRLKLPRKHEQIETTSVNIPTKEEPKQKRTRRRPKRYDDFDLTLKENTSLDAAESLKSVSKAKPCDETIISHSPVALLRLDNRQVIGTLADSERKGEIKVTCQVCSEVFRAEKKFQQHIKKHYTKDPLSSKNVLRSYFFHCKICDKPFHEHRAARRHYKFAHTEERPFKCSHCEASFKYRFNLNYHTCTIHIPKKRFECKFCTKKFFMRYELQIHVRTHTKEKPFKCEFCTFASAHKSNLKTHLRVKHFENFSTNGVTILKQLFKPPVELIEEETEITDDLSAPKAPDSNGSGDSCLTNERPKCRQSILEQDAIFQYELTDKNNDSADTAPQSEQLNLNESVPTLLKYDCQPFTKENVLNDQQKPSQTAKEEENLFEFDINDKNIADTILTTFENYVENLEGENVKNKTIEPAESIIQTESETNTKEDSILRAITNENSEGFPKQQANLNIQIDSSLLKSLPSASLLGLKKWPKFFQSTPNKEMQLVKRSHFSNENPSVGNTSDEYKDINNKSFKNVSAQPSTSLMRYKTSPEIENFRNSQQMTDNKNCNFHHTLEDITSFNDTESFEDTASDSNRLKEIKKSGQHFSAESEQKAKNELNKNKIRNASSKELKVSSRPIKIKNILHSKQSNLSHKMSTVYERTEATNNNVSIKKYLPNKSLKNIHNSQEIKVSDSGLKPLKNSSDTTNRSLLKSATKNPQTTTLSLTSCSGPKETVLPCNPLITKVEILPSLKNLTNITSKPTNLMKSPSDHKFQCPHCYKYFKQKSPLIKHLRTHTGEKPYKCNLCPKAYADASNYKKHKTLHRNAAEALNISRTTAPANSYAVQSSPAYSTVSDPDPDGIEVMQTLKKFISSATEDDDEIDDNTSTSSSNMETQMWSDILDQALNSEEIKEQMRRNLFGINNAIMPKNMQQIANSIEHFSTEDPD